MEVATCLCARRTAAGDVILGNCRHLALDEVFFTTDRFVGDDALCHQESVGRDAQRGMVVEPPPASTLVVPQAEVLLQILVVAFNAPVLPPTEN